MHQRLAARRAGDAVESTNSVSERYLQLQLDESERANAAGAELGAKFTLQRLRSGEGALPLDEVTRARYSRSVWRHGPCSPPSRIASARRMTGASPSVVSQPSSSAIGTQRASALSLAGGQRARRRAAEEIEDDVVVLDAAVVVAHDAIEHLDDGAERAGEPGLLAQLAQRRLFQRLADLDAAAGHRPASHLRRAARAARAARDRRRAAARRRRPPARSGWRRAISAGACRAATLSDSATPSRSGTIVVNRSGAAKASLL